MLRKWTLLLVALVLVCAGTALLVVQRDAPVDGALQVRGTPVADEAHELPKPDQDKATPFIESVPLEPGEEQGTGSVSASPALAPAPPSRRKLAFDDVRVKLSKDSLYALQQMGGDEMVMEVAEILPELGDPRLSNLRRVVGEFGVLCDRVTQKLTVEMSNYAEAELKAGRGAPLPRDGTPAFSSVGTKAPYLVSDNGRQFVVVRRGFSNEWDARYRQHDDEIQALGQSMLESLRRELNR